MQKKENKWDPGITEDSVHLAIIERRHKKIVQRENDGRHKARPGTGEKKFRQHVHQHTTEQQMKENCKTECPFWRHKPKQETQRIKNGGFKMSPERHS